MCTSSVNSKHSNILVAFDLDDTLYPEISFVQSGMSLIKEITAQHPHWSLSADEAIESLKHGVNPFIPVWTKLAESDNPEDKKIAEEIRTLDIAYRTHKAQIELYADVREVLPVVAESFPTALITDGRSNIQRNKISLLGLNKFIPASNIFISEETGADKTAPLPFELAQATGRYDKCIYVGDNVNKDFVHPNSMGWLTIAVADRGCNIFSQQDFQVPVTHAPQVVIKSFHELLPLLDRISSK